MPGSMRLMAYQPIGNYGVIGDMHTAALIGRHGSVDWLCLPRFDSPSVFAALLDDEKGGTWSIQPVDAQVRSKQFYWPQTNVLVTRFFTDTDSVEVTDFMPVGEAACDRRRIIRRVSGVRGSLRLRMTCRPAFNYAQDVHELQVDRCCARFISGDASFVIHSNCRMKPDDSAAVADLNIDEGHMAVFVLEHSESIDPPAEDRGLDDMTSTWFEQTVGYWRRWLGQCAYHGRWQDVVHRSALTLKLMTYEPTGAIIAAMTCSLPESLGGGRNWDYRYVWIRDAAFSVYALLRLGFADEAAGFMDFLARHCRTTDTDRPLQNIYGIDGRCRLTEIELDHLKGYRDSRPVRIGNDAYKQLQLDIYGELLDAAYLFNKWGQPVSSQTWQSLRRMVDWVCENWDQPDAGIWEARDAREHYVYSKLMCWVAVDRGLRLAERRSFPADRVRWQKIRDEIYEDIYRRGYHTQRQAFVQAYDSDALDAAVLIMPLVFFTSPTDPKMTSTLDVILRSPEDGGLASNGLVHRYDVEKTPDGLSGSENAFNICTFWLVEALTRAGRFQPERLQQARLIFERMHSFANHLGLYGEQTGPGGEALGNFPQAFTHLSLISAAYNLDKALNQRHITETPTAPAIHFPTGSPHPDHH